MHLNPITYTKQNKNIMQNKAMVRGGTNYIIVGILSFCTQVVLFLLLYFINYKRNVHFKRGAAKWEEGGDVHRKEARAQP